MIKKALIGAAIAGGILISATPAFAAKAVNMLTGGGMIVDGDYSVSFGGNIKEMADGSLKGQMQANFHNVSNGDVVMGRFHSTEITDANWFSTNAGTCTAAMNVTMDGRFNGEDGWRLVFIAGDDEDTVRLRLFDGGGAVYDTSSGDFGDESSCFGTNRTGLDHGNVRIVTE